LFQSVIQLTVYKSAKSAHGFSSPLLTKASSIYPQMLSCFFIRTSDKEKHSPGRLSGCVTVPVADLNVSV